MNTPSYIKRQYRNKHYLHETWLNNAPFQEWNQFLIKLWAVGRETICPGSSYHAPGNNINNLVFVFNECYSRLEFKHRAPQVLRREDGLFIAPGSDIRTLIRNESSLPAVRYYLHLERNVHLEQMFGLQETDVIRMQDPQTIYGLLQKICQMAADCCHYTPEDFSCISFELLTRLCSGRRISVRFTGTYAILLTAVAKYPENYPTLKSLMTLFGVSREKLETIFRENTGYSPMAFVIHSRLYNSCWQLTYTEMSIQEIALLNGYQNGAFYSNAFRKEYGLSPLAYRKREQKSNRINYKL